MLRWWGAWWNEPGTGADAAKPHLAACGAAAAWRLGQWELLDSYLEQTRLPVPVLDAGDQWEVRLGELFSALHRRRALRFIWCSIVQTSTLPSQGMRQLHDISTRLETPFP